LRSCLAKYATLEYATVHNNNAKIRDALKPFVDSGVDSLCLYMKLEDRPAKKPK
jgi:hypothetical protein